VLLNNNRLIVTFIIVFSLLNPLLNGAEKRPISKYWLEMFILNSDLIIKGEIIAIEARLMDANLVYQSRINHDMVVTELTIQIEKVIAGEYEGDTIKAILKEGELNGRKSMRADHALLNPKEGESIIIALGYNIYGNNLYILHHRNAFFKIEGDSLLPYEKESFLDVSNPLEVIEAKAEERQFNNMYRAADLICLGFVKEIYFPTQLSAQFKVGIKEIFKGPTDLFELTVDGSNIRWVFKEGETDYQVLLFLQKDKDVYKTVAGINGYYTVENNKLIRIRHAPLRTNLTDLKSQFNIWKALKK